MVEVRVGYLEDLIKDAIMVRDRLEGLALDGKIDGDLLLEAGLPQLIGEIRAAEVFMPAKTEAKQ